MNARINIFSFLHILGKLSYTAPLYTAQWYSVACIRVARYLDRPTIEVTGKVAIN